MTQTEKKTFGKIALPHIVAVALFFIISIVYFSPVLDGKSLVGSDTESWIGMSKEARDFNATHSEGTLWTNSMFGGMPTYQIAGPKSYDFLTIVVGDTLYQLPRVVYTLFLYLIGFYILMLCFDVKPWLSLVLAPAFAFCSYNLIILAAGHDTKALSIAYMPAVIGSVIYSFRKNKYIGAVLTAFFLALLIRANHLQIVYYTLIALIIYGISELIFAIKEKRLKPMFGTLGLLVVSAVIAVGLNATMLIITKEYSDYTMRGRSNGLTIDKSSQTEGLDKDYITGWSYGIGETFTLLIPDFKGGASQEYLPVDSKTGEKLKELGANPEAILTNQPMPTYWGTQPFTAGPVYAGAIVCFLALLALLIAPNRERWWLLAAFVVGVLLSWGRNFPALTNFFIDYVPLYNMFRTVSMTLVISCLALAVLAGLALKYWFWPVEGTPSADEKFRRKALYISAGVTGGLCLLFWLIPSIAGDFKADVDGYMVQNGYPSFFLDTLPADRKAMLSSSALRSLIFIALAFVVLLFSKTNDKKSAGKIPMYGAFVALGVLVLIDMVPIAKRYLNNTMFKKQPKMDYFQPSAADEMILADKSEHRVLDLTTNVFNSSKPSYFHHSIGGYHAAKLRRYQELINIHIDKEISNIITTFQVASSAKDVNELNSMFANAFSQCKVLNMLNMKYVIYNPDQAPLQNPYANGPAWIVKQAIMAETPDEEMMALGRMDNKQSLVFDKEYKDMVPEEFINKKGVALANAVDSAAVISLVSYAPNHLQYSYKSSTKSLAVFSEIYYDKGWNAYVDGKPAEYFRANYLLRAMSLPAGEHKIEFKFEPQSYATGNLLRSIATVLFLLAVGALAVYYYKRKRAS